MEENNIQSSNLSNDIDSVDIDALMEEFQDSTNSNASIEDNHITTEESNEVNTPNNSSTDVQCIPKNSPTVLIDQTTLRFSGAEWFNEIQKARIIIAGVGGIGSNLAFQLARMCPANITLYDADIVETVNLAGQLYSYADIGSFKVNAVASMMSSYTTIKQINAIPEKFTNNSEPGDIMMCGFDNMEARKTFFASWCRHIQDKSPEDKAKCLFLDGRLSMDTLQIFCITGDDDYNRRRYKKDFLFSDSEAELTVCSMKQTTYLACMIGSLMTNLFTNFIANSLNPIIPYDLPFYTEYDAQNMLFNTEK